MKNTKILFIRLYIGTLYSNFIVPLRGSNYIQLLYRDLKQRSVSFLEQIRWLVWQEYINELGQRSDNIGTVFKAKIGANRGKSGQFIRQECYQKRPNATRKQGDQRRLKVTRYDPLTYHYLILPNNLFMFCVG